MKGLLRGPQLMPLALLWCALGARPATRPKTLCPSGFSCPCGYTLRDVTVGPACPGYGKCTDDASFEGDGCDAAPEFCAEGTCALAGAEESQRAASQRVCQGEEPMGTAELLLRLGCSTLHSTPQAALGSDEASETPEGVQPEPTLSSADEKNGTLADEGAVLITHEDGAPADQTSTLSPASELSVSALVHTLFLAV